MTVSPILILGANGATGQILTQTLLDRDLPVLAMVRRRDSLPPSLADHPNLTLIEASLLDLSENELTSTLRLTNAVVSCLGHNLSFRGVFGSPRRLVTDSVKRIANSVSSSARTRFLLLNTVGVPNLNLSEPRTRRCRITTKLMTHLLPPYADNLAAAEFLRTSVNSNKPHVEWIVARPDSLHTNSDFRSYHTLPSPNRSPISNPGKTNQHHLADFMADVITDSALWKKWRFQMPVIYDD